MIDRIWHMVGGALAAAALLGVSAAADTGSAAAALEASEAAPAPTLRPHMAALINGAQDKLRAKDLLGAITDLDKAMAQRPTPLELGVTLAVRGGALYERGDLDGAVADWTRALAAGSLDESTQIHLVHNIERIEAALIAR